MASALGLAAVLLWLAWPRRGVRADDGRASATTKHGRRARSALRRGGGDRGAALAAARSAHAAAIASSGAAAQVAKGELVVKAPWGSGAGALGRRRAHESNPESPMSVAIDRQGRVAVLDQVNGRLTRYDRSGRQVGSVALDTTTAQDVSFDADGRALVLDRHTRRDVQIFDADGKRVGSVPLVGGKVSEAGTVSGVFSDADGIYVEVGNDQVVRVADSAGQPTGGQETIPGRPTRDGKLVVRAGIVQRDSGRVYVQAHERQRSKPGQGMLAHALVWETPLRLAAPVIEILMLDSDRQGNVYLAVEIGRRDEATNRMVDQATIVVKLDGKRGALVGDLRLPSTLANPAETFRPLAVTDAGEVVQMLASSEGVTVRRYQF
ncbi:MAG: hypothetical protein KC503_26975 [Myxococcales bacterium]|nr:hypothetical protein [Myxococcales bacterium]